MGFKKKSGLALLLIMLLGCLSFNVFARDYSTIKVGLETVYNNVNQISLSSDGALSFGYYEEGDFRSLGTLPSNAITIQKATEQYMNLGGMYSSYDEAASIASSLMAIPVYIEEGLFGVYSTNCATGIAVPASSERYVVKDAATGSTLLIFHKATKNIEFRGYDAGTGIYLTKVGSSKKYRGAIGIGGTTGITPYNVIDMEQYLYGVVPNEMMASWPKEALKAQAVAARSIAIYQYNRHISKGYNVVDSTATQAYGGYNKEDSRTTAAVDETAGQTLKYNGKVAEALYFSTSGGATESAVNVWGTEIPYLIGVKDIYETEPAQKAWTREFTLEDINECLGRQGINIGSAKGIKIVSRTNSGRVQEMKIIGTLGEYSLSAEKIRTFFSGTAGGSLKSRLFSFNPSIIAGDGSNNSGNQPSTGSDMVTVLSAYGRATANPSELMLTNGNSTQKSNGQLTILSAYGTATVQGNNGNNNNNQSGQNGALNNEEVWGNFTVYGKGFGHGVGMSQSGAMGMAKAGYNYIDILKFYYNGVTIG